MKKNEKIFLLELQVLLAKYDAEIGWDCGVGSDLHGVYDECITVSMGNKEVFRTNKGNDCLSISSFMSAKELQSYNRSDE
jgi:hypothetical protein